MIGDSLETKLRGISGSCPDGGSLCEPEPYSTDLESEGSSFTMKLISSDTAEHRGGRFGIRAAPSQRSTGKAGHPNGGSAGVGMMSADWPPSCLDIGIAIGQATPKYNEARRVYTNALKNIAPIQWENGTPRVVDLRDYPEITMALGTAFYEMQSMTLQLSIMAGLYSANAAGIIPGGMPRGGRAGGTGMIPVEAEAGGTTRSCAAMRYGGSALTAGRRGSPTTCRSASTRGSRSRSAVTRSALWRPDLRALPVSRNSEQ